jgi:Ca-activated chloride channel family protein
MAAENKLDAVQRALRVLVGRLRPQDRITLVAWSDEARVVARCASAADPALLAAIDELRPDGSTNLHAGLVTALREVSGQPLAADGLRRVVLLTDGIANRGVTDAERVLTEARAFTSDGVDLATIGFGTELNGELLDRLARGARGMFHFVRDAADIEKVFVDELQAQLRTVLRDVSLSLSLPPEIELGRVFGHRARLLAVPGEYAIDLPDLNAGATQVVLVECRLRGDLAFEPAGEALEVRASLHGRAAGTEARLVEFPARATLAARRGAEESLVDAEVAKNHTIARVAQGLHDMAVAAQQQRWAAADAALRDALRLAERRFPSGEDEDLARVTKMARQYRQTLRAHLDRFRDA